MMYCDVRDRLLYVFYTFCVVSLSPFPLLHASLRGNKVAPSHVPFFLNSPKERKGRSVVILICQQYFFLGCISNRRHVATA